MRYTGPKRRLSRREGVALFPKDIKSIERKGAVPPGHRGTKMKRRLSEFRSKSATGQTLLEILETRIDNIVYRLGFAKSRTEARQIVSHGHILIDNKKLTIPSARVKVNSTVAISPKFVDNTQVKKNLEESREIPGWLERKAAVGKVLRLPTREEMESIINEQLIVEYYSR